MAKRNPAAPKYGPGDRVTLACRASGRADTGGYFSLARGEPLTVVAVLPESAWGLPEWPRYELRDRKGRTVRLDEGHLTPADPPAPGTPAVVKLPPRPGSGSLFDQGE